MALANFPVSIQPDWGFADEPSADIKRIKFGDGYELRTPVGLNYTKRKWAPVWSYLTKEQSDIIYEFIVPKLNFTAFNWTHPVEDVQYAVLCTSINRTHDTYGNYVIHLNLEQDFNPV